ncbi:MAG: tyrosine--tRNA ligase [Candidatus Limnocylindria bacterium]
MPVRPTETSLDEFLTRAVARVIDRENLRALLASGERRLVIKQGFDPTRPNLHLGHVVCLRKLRQFAEWGHEIVIIVGDWTTQIGDPTDRDESRPTMSHEQVLENAATYLAQFHRVVPREGVRIVHQNEWFGRFTLTDVIRLAARFTTQQMLAREEFRKRMAANAPIPVKDLLYPLLQAYDSVAIESDVEVGGTDQEFNVLVGRQLQGQVGQRPQNVFIIQLLEGLDGEKMSKSKPATAIWLTDTPEQVYGKVMAIKDDLMPHYFEWATDMPLGEVRATLEALAKQELHPRDAKAMLARRITSELHSPAAAEEASVAFARQFRERGAPAEAEVVTLARDGSGFVPVVDLLVRAGLASSRSEARRVVSQGGVRVDGRAADASTAVASEGEPLVQVGRRQARRIRWAEGA